MSKEEKLIKRTGIEKKLIDYLKMTHPEVLNIDMDNWDVGMWKEKGARYILVQASGGDMEFFTWAGLWRKGEITEEYFRYGSE